MRWLPRIYFTLSANVPKTIQKLVKLHTSVWYQYLIPSIMIENCVPKYFLSLKIINIEPKLFLKFTNFNRSLTPTLAEWPLRGHMALKSILWETLFLDQLHDFSLLSLISFLHPFLRSKFMKKISWHLKNFVF